MRTLWKPGLVAAAVAVVVAGAGGGGGQALAGTTKASGAASGLGPLTGSLPRKKLTLESAINVDLSKETVRLPLYTRAVPTARRCGTCCSTRLIPAPRTTSG